MLLVQQYLKSGKTLEQLHLEHGVKSHVTNGKVCLNYDQLEASNSDPIASQCRGLVLREGSWDIVACPMFRFFNIEQTEVASDIDWESASYFEKMDGSCIIVYYDHILSKWCCGTRGRAEADGEIDGGDLTFAMLVDNAATAMWQHKNPTCIRDHIPMLEDLMQDYNSLNDLDAKQRTFIFELTSPINRIVCKYNNTKLTLLAVRDNISLQEEDPKLWNTREFGVECPKEYSFSNINHMIQVIRDWNPEDHEGVVVRDKNFNRIKVKNPSYLSFNKLRDSLATSVRGCIEVILLGKEDDVIGMIPEPIAKRILRLKPVVSQVLKQTQNDFDELKDIEDIKEFALAAQQKLWPSALFALKRGKTSDLKTYSLGNKSGVTKIPTNASETMLNLAKKIDPEVGKLEL